MKHLESEIWHKTNQKFEGGWCYTSNPVWNKVRKFEYSIWIAVYGRIGIMIKQEIHDLNS